LGLRNDLTQFSPQYVKLDRTDLYTQVEEPSKAIDISCGLLHTAVISSKSRILYIQGITEFNFVERQVRLLSFGHISSFLKPFTKNSN